jgi:hypothetical protein
MYWNAECRYVEFRGAKNEGKDFFFPAASVTKENVLKD